MKYIYLIPLRTGQETDYVDGIQLYLSDLKSVDSNISSKSILFSQNKSLTGVTKKVFNTYWQYKRDPQVESITIEQHDLIPLLMLCFMTTVMQK